jgi:hypothetical protein
MQPLGYRVFGALEQMQRNLYDDALASAATQALSKADAVRPIIQAWERTTPGLTKKAWSWID